MESIQNEKVIIIDDENEGLNECNMEDEIFYVRFLTKQSTTKQTNVKFFVPIYERNEVEKNLQRLHTQRKVWNGHTRNAICWAFYCANDDKEADLGNLQIMRC
jgi:hypothetical protein